MSLVPHRGVPTVWANDAISLHPGARRLSVRVR